MKSDKLLLLGLLTAHLYHVDANRDFLDSVTHLNCYCAGTVYKLNIAYDVLNCCLVCSHRIYFGLNGCSVSGPILYINSSSFCLQIFFYTNVVGGLHYIPVANN